VGLGNLDTVKLIKKNMIKYIMTPNYVRVLKTLIDGLKLIVMKIMIKV